jgi:putative transposase
MSKPTIPLTPGNYYHIYNRGINSCPIFYDDSDHKQFLYLYGKYVSQVADTFAWVLMRTHFHLLVRIKEDMVYRYSMEEIRQMEAAQNTGRSGRPASPSDDATGFSGDTTFFSYDKLAFAKWETVSRKDFGTRAAKTPEHQRAGSGKTSRECGKAKTPPTPSAHFGHLFNAYARYFNLKYHRHGSLLEHRFKRKLIKDDRYRRNVVVYIHKNPEHHGYYADFRKYPWSSFNSCQNKKPALISRKEVLGWFGSTTNFLIVHRTEMNTDALEQWLNEE